MISFTTRENGYHEYDEAVVDDLLKIKFLRTIGLSIETIKQIQKHNISLSEAIKQRIEEIKKEKKDLETALSICQKIIDDGVDYESLINYQFVLENTNSFDISNDSIEIVKKPLKRFLARLIDLGLYQLFILFITVVLFRIPVLSSNVKYKYTYIIIGILSAAMMLFVEPLLISKLSTTFGKWVFGMKITDYDNQKLSYQQAFSRTKDVLFNGIGFNIPGLSAYLMFKSFKKVDNGEVLSWQKDYKISDKEVVLVPIISCVCYVGLSVLVIIKLLDFCYTPLYKGDLTVKQLADNYHYLYECYGYNYGIYDPVLIGEDGNWLKNYTFADGSTIEYNYTHLPEITITKTNNIVKKIELSYECNNYADISSAGSNEMVLLSISLLKSKGELKTLSETSKFVNQIVGHIDENFTIETDNYLIFYTVEANNLQYSGNRIWFSMTGSGSLKYQFIIQEK